MTRRSRPASDYVNHYIEDRGRRYRVCLHGTNGHLMVVGLQSKKVGGRERLLALEGPTANRLARAARAKATTEAAHQNLKVERADNRFPPTPGVGKAIKRATDAEDAAAARSETLTSLESIRLGVIRQRQLGNDLADTAQAFLDEYGGDVPDWLRDPADRLLGAIAAWRK